jgi:hypothetical protein
MADELDTGAAYLASLKRSSSAQAPAPARSTEGGPGSTTQRPETHPSSSPSLPQRAIVQIVEKRRSPRYRCQGGARLQLAGEAASLWATFTDISLHGCYVEMPNTLRVGTILNLRLECQGVRIEAIGEVRVAYPGVGMGISFSKMSDQDQTQLRELVHSISGPSVILNSRVVTRSLSAPAPDPGRAVQNPAAALQAIFSFFETRHILGREEFLRIIRASQDLSK